MMHAFGPVNLVSKRVLGLPKEDWFVLQTSPTPEKKDIEKVTADIINDNEIFVKRGKLHHADNCTSCSHELRSEVRSVLDSIQNITFTVAVYRGWDGLFEGQNLLYGQPIAVSLDPLITYETFPDHPHLNTSYFVNGKLVVPASLCYTDNTKGLGETEDMKLYNAFKYISIWLFRHQIWMETRKKFGKGIWIGPQVGGLPPGIYTMVLNPLGTCRCGSGLMYKSCHMPQDFSIRRNISISEAKHYITDNMPILVEKYNNNLLYPEQAKLQSLKESLLV